MLSNIISSIFEPCSLEGVLWNNMLVFYILNFAQSWFVFFMSFCMKLEDSEPEVTSSTIFQKNSGFPNF